MINLIFSHCNSSHAKASEKIVKIVQEKLPFLFQGHLLCAGSIGGRRGSCKGDSGGPLLIFDFEKEAYVQIATVEGARILTNSLLDHDMIC